MAKHAALARLGRDTCRAAGLSWSVQPNDVRKSPEQGQHGDELLLAQPLFPPHDGRPHKRPLAKLEAVPGLFLPLIGLSI